jgi:hypothetical protein
VASEGWRERYHLEKQMIQREKQMYERVDRGKTISD